MTALPQAQVDAAYPPLKLAGFPRRPLSDAPDFMRRDDSSNSDAALSYPRGEEPEAETTIYANQAPVTAHKARSL
ncbi:MAG: hypothetical protein GEU75_12275 [Dehalococcoidia bacterium]|nr:hypothetical protein [Dehalococcoidia bacterium]